MATLKSVERIIVHHSGSSLKTTTEQMRRYHMAPKPRGNGWDDIGYHFVIEQAGAVKYGRPLPLVGAHCRGFNRTSIGICVVGDNTNSNHRWTAAQRAALTDLIASLRFVFGEIPVLGHRDLSTGTVCPGTDVVSIYN